MDGKPISTKQWKKNLCNFWVCVEKCWSSCTMEYFEMQELIDTLDVALNFQMHQLTLTATHEDAKRRCINAA